MARSVSAESLKEGSLIKVSGTIAYSRVTSVIQGDELARRVAADRARGSIYPTDVPHTTMSLIDPVVVGTGAGGALTREETFVSDGIYLAGKGDSAGHRVFNIDSKGTQLPTVLEQQADGSYSQVQPTGELAKGLAVTLILNVYKPKNHPKRGIGIQAVLVNEPVRTYGTGGAAAVAAALAAAGVTVNGSISTAEPAGAATVAPAMGFEEAMAAAEALSMPGVFDPASVEAPVAAPTPVVASQPVVTETADEHIARLTAELAAAKASAPRPQVGSPWDVGATV